MGFAEETGAAQHLRDARIAPIYEGTNGIQALDLVGRKLTLGAGMPRVLWLDAIGASAEALSLEDDMDRAAAMLTEGHETLADTTEWLLERLSGADGADDLATGATPYLQMFAAVSCAHLLARQAIEAAARIRRGEGDAGFLDAKLVTVRFFLTQILPQAIALADAVKAGAQPLFAIGEARL